MIVGVDPANVGIDCQFQDRAQRFGTRADFLLPGVIALRSRDLVTARDDRTSERCEADRRLCWNEQRPADRHSGPPGAHSIGYARLAIDDTGLCESGPDCLVDLKIGFDTGDLGQRWIELPRGLRCPGASRQARISVRRTASRSSAVNPSGATRSYNPIRTTSPCAVIVAARVARDGQVLCPQT